MALNTKREHVFQGIGNAEGLTAAAGDMDECCRRRVSAATRVAVPDASTTTLTVNSGR